MTLPYWIQEHWDEIEDIKTQAYRKGLFDAEDIAHLISVETDCPQCQRVANIIRRKAEEGK